MNAQAILGSLRGRGIMLWVSKGALYFDGPEDVVTEADVEALREHKQAIVATITREARGHLQEGWRALPVMMADSPEDILVGPPGNNLYARGAGHHADYVACRSIPAWATEYRIYNDTWATIPGHWRPEVAA